MDGRVDEEVLEQLERYFRVYEEVLEELERYFRVDEEVLEELERYFTGDEEVLEELERYFRVDEEVLEELDRYFRVDEEVLEELDRYLSKTPVVPDTLPLPSDVTTATSDVDDTFHLDAILEALDPVVPHLGTTPVDDVSTATGDSLPVTSSPLVRTSLSGKLYNCICRRPPSWAIIPCLITDHCH